MYQLFYTKLIWFMIIYLILNLLFSRKQDLNDGNFDGVI